MRFRFFISSLFTLCLLASPPSDETSLAGMLRAQLDDGSTTLMPLKLTDVDLDVTGDVVHGLVRQVYVNDLSAYLEAVYTFPLPVDATVVSMTLEYGDKRIRSVVKEKEIAKREYSEARSTGRRAALLEQDRPNLFTTSVANIPPDTEVQIEFGFVFRMPFVVDRYELTFPTVFGPRYVPEHHLKSDPIMASTAPAEIGRLIPPLLHSSEQHFFRFQARVRGLPLETATSNTHDVVAEEVDYGVFDVSLMNRFDLPDRDLQLVLKLWPGETPVASLIESFNRDGVIGLLHVVPPLDEGYQPEILPRDVIFLVDTSGSMSGTAIEQAKLGLMECLEMLGPQDRFNITRFSSNFSSWRPSFEEASDTNLRTAETFVDQLAASGGTNMQLALSEVLSLPAREDSQKVVIFITDGDVGNEASLLRLVQQKRNGARIFSFGIGSAPNEFLVRKVSRLGHGEAHFIRNERDIAHVVSEFFETVNSPVLTDIELTWRSRTGDQVEAINQVPSVVPDLYLGRPIQLICQYAEPFEGSLEVGGFIGDQWQTYSYEFPRRVVDHVPGLNALYGQSIVQERMADWYATTDQDLRDFIRDEVVQLGLDYQLVTHFTSRIAIEERVTVNPDGEHVTVQVPVMAKDGTYPATATSDVTLLLTGFLMVLVALGLQALRQRRTFGSVK